MEKTDDITPTWSALLASGNLGKEQLKKMAQIADRAVVYQEAIGDMVKLAYKLQHLVNVNSLDGPEKRIFLDIRKALETYIGKKEKLLESLKENPVKTIGDALATIHAASGFSPAHARIGRLGAEFYKQYGTLKSWHMKPWLEVVDGYPRICRYAELLKT